LAQIEEPAMKCAAVLLAAVCFACAPGAAAERAPAAPNRPAADGRRAVKLPHLRIDRAKRQIVLDANVALREGWLELLLCRRGTRDYESILNTRARPSHLHAALLLLGLRPGKPAEFVPAGEGEPPTYLPPRGAGIKVALRWTDAKGRRHEADPGKWLATAEGRQAETPEQWIFVGSEVLADGSYSADRTDSGRIICVANFPDAVIDVPFESSASNEMLSFTAKTDAIPPRGTKVQVVLTVAQGAENAPHARALLEIGRHGRLRADGEPIAFEQIESWAGKFVKRHAKGRVVVRTAPKAFACDLERVRGELEFAGVPDIKEQRLLPKHRLLPRTAAQAQRALETYGKDLRHREWAVPDPVEAAEEELRRLRRERQELKRLDALWQEYRDHLRQHLRKYRASTQPAEPDDRGDSP
jgi:uncharacterized protein YifE (UPF0438 family)